MSLAPGLQGPRPPHIQYCFDPIPTTFITHRWSSRVVNHPVFYKYNYLKENINISHTLCEPFWMGQTFWETTQKILIWDTITVDIFVCKKMCVRTIPLFKKLNKNFNLFCFFYCGKMYTKFTILSIFKCTVQRH